MADQKPSWTLQGSVLVSCNCDYGCPCNFNARPTHGKCEGGWTWHVERGSFDGVTLDGLNFSVYANWPGAIHEGNGEALILIDARADDRQRDALATLMRGEVGGPWGVLAWTWPTIHGPLRGPLRSGAERHLDEDQGRPRAGGGVDDDQESGQRRRSASRHRSARGDHRQAGGSGMFEGLPRRRGDRHGSLRAVHRDRPLQLRLSVTLRLRSRRSEQAPLPDGEQCRRAAQVDLAVHDRRRRDERLLLPACSSPAPRRSVPSSPR